MRTMMCKVAGVTFEGRQAFLRELNGGEPAQLRPEPQNSYDPNAVAVYVKSAGGATYHIGYVPRELAKIVAPLLEGETIVGRVFEITGGFTYHNGDLATLGCVIEVDIPEDGD
jgi:hypothetical protein